MLTGPVTTLLWSFPRDDEHQSLQAQQLALAIRDEVLDLEQAGIAIIQVDEPAFREGLPLRQSEWEAYLHWAGDAFRLATSGIQDKTQCHSHFCYVCSSLFVAFSGFVAYSVTFDSRISLTLSMRLSNSMPMLFLLSNLRVTATFSKCSRKAHTP